MSRHVPVHMLSIHMLSIHMLSIHMLAATKDDLSCCMVNTRRKAAAPLQHAWSCNVKAATYLGRRVHAQHDAHAVPMQMSHTCKLVPCHGTPDIN